jgi:APA family basic amino acid/polyamine antiporter
MEGATAATAAETEGLRPELTLFDSAMIVAGSMIGSGIFIVSADIARNVGSPGALLAVWIISGLMTIAGALAYGELSAMMPQAGGQYVFLREAYGGLWAFLFGWTLLLVIQTGTIAAVAVAFARFLGVIWPVLGSELWFGGHGMGLSGERVGAIIVIVTLTATNLLGLDMGRMVQNSFTVAKVMSLLLIIAVASLLFPNAAAVHSNFGSAHSFWASGLPQTGFLAAFGAAMVGGLFSADAWAGVTFTAAEVRNPRRDLPLALTFGTGVVIVLYVLTNLAYLCQLPVQGAAQATGAIGQGIAHATSDRVAAAAMQVVWGGAGATLTAILVMISTFGCANGMILTGARVIYAMAHDGVFFSAAKKLNRARVPAFALVAQAIWACVLAVSGTYSDLLDYVIFAQLLFYVLTVAAVFLLRRTRANTPRPYRAWGYPIVPAAYIVAAVVLMIDLLIVKPRNSWAGVAIVLAGVPVYVRTARRRGAR